MLKLFIWNGFKRVLYPYPGFNMKHFDPALPVSTPIERDNSKRFKSDE